MKAQAYFSEAKKAAPGIRWLVQLAQPRDEDSSSLEENPILMEQIERVERVLANLGMVHDGKFAKREKEILDGLQSNEKGSFEHAHKLLGEMLGFEAGNVEQDGSPDSWWIAGNICFVFEDHAGAQETSALDVRKARQVATHPDWMREHVEASVQAEILPVLITPVKKFKEAAYPHLKKVALWPLDEFRNWATRAIAIIRGLRPTFVAPGEDLVWRATAATKFGQNQLDASSLNTKLRSRLVVDSLDRIK